jgi:hypothetical protein
MHEFRVFGAFYVVDSGIEPQRALQSLKTNLNVEAGMTQSTQGWIIDMPPRRNRPHLGFLSRPTTTGYGTYLHVMGSLG